MTHRSVVLWSSKQSVFMGYVRKTKTFPITRELKLRARVLVICQGSYSTVLVCFYRSKGSLGRRPPMQQSSYQSGLSHIKNNVQIQSSSMLRHSRFLGRWCTCNSCIAKNNQCFFWWINQEVLPCDTVTCILIRWSYNYNNFQPCIKFHVIKLTFSRTPWVLLSVELTYCNTTHSAHQKLYIRHFDLRAIGYHHQGHYDST